MSAETGSLVLQLGGLLAVVLMAAKTRNRRLSVWVAMPLMLAVSVVAQTVIAGEGIAAPLTFVALSVLAVVLIYVTVSVAEKLDRRKL